jgi:hypothetical protein
MPSFIDQHRPGGAVPGDETTLRQKSGLVEANEQPIGFGGSLAFHRSPSPSSVLSGHIGARCKRYQHEHNFAGTGAAAPGSTTSISLPPGWIGDQVAKRRACARSRATCISVRRC